MRPRSLFPTQLIVAVVFLALALSGQAVLGGAGLSPLSPGASVLADDEAGDEDDGNEGHGNKDDKDNGDHESNGNKHDEDDGDGNEGPGDNNGNGKGKDEKKAKVKLIDPYTVDVRCAFNAGAGQSSCFFSGLTPYGDERALVIVPVEAVCAAVATGGASMAQAPVPGYRSQSGAGSFELLLDGQVETGGQATYWILTDDGLYPARGPALVCATERRMLAAQPADPTPSAAPTESAPAPAATPVAATGSVLVEAFDCPIATPTGDFDWFGACNPAGPDVRFSLGLPDSETADRPTATTGENGQARFGRLAPGNYELLEVAGSWCHAESDSVNAQGEVVVRENQLATVWIFHCTGGGS